MLPTELRPWAAPAADSRKAGLVSGDVRRDLQTVMTAEVGVQRSATGLSTALDKLQALVGDTDAAVDQDAWETTNLVTVSLALADAARLREETRGSHWREDFPERNDAAWAGHFDTVMTDGAATLAFAPEPATDGPHQETAP